MTKHDDDAAAKAKKRIETEPLPDPVDRPVTELLPVKRLSPVPGRVDRADLAVIVRAITLFLARSADLDDDSLEKSGKAIAAISRFYLRHERSHPHAHEDAQGTRNEGAS